jgi:hypothetical protein
MTSTDQLKKRLDALAPAAGTYQPRDFKKDEQAINAIIREVWPSFNEDNGDLLAPDGSGVSRCFGDTRYREIEKRVSAYYGSPAGGNHDGH